MKKYLLLLTASLSLTVSNGQTTFQRTYGGTGDEEGIDVQLTNDGGFVFAGVADSFFFGSPKIYLVKTFSDGTLQWTKTFAISGDDFAVSIKQTNDNGFIITGKTYIQTSLQNDVFLMKTDPVGNLQWARSYGGGYGDYGQCLQQTTDGGYIISGFTSSFGAGNNDIYILKTDSDGYPQWKNTYGGTGDEQGNSIQQTIDGGYIITGLSYSFGSGYEDVYLLKIASNGNFQWSKTFGSTYVENGSCVKQTQDSGYVIVGSTRSYGAGSRNAYLIKTHSDGSLQWSKTFGGTNWEIGYSVAQSFDGGFVVAGSANSFGAGSNDIYLFKADTDGNLLWSNTIGGTKADAGYSIQQTSDSGFVITGVTQSFGMGRSDAFLIKCDSKGNSDCNNNSVTTITTTPSTVSSNHTALVSTGGTVGSFVFHVDSVGVETSPCTLIGINEISPNHFSNIFPNPFSSQTTLQTTTALQNASLTVYNSVGQTVKHVDNLAGQTVIFHRDNLPSGLYFVRLTQDGNTISADKFVITDK